MSMYKYYCNNSSRVGMTPPPQKKEEKTKKTTLPSPITQTDLLGFVSSPPQSREDPVRPIVGGHIQTAKHLGSGDGLGVHPHLFVGFSTVCHGLHQHVDTLGLPCPGGSKGHHSVSHPLGLKQLDQFQDPRSMEN